MSHDRELSEAHDNAFHGLNLRQETDRRQIINMQAKRIQELKDAAKRDGYLFTTTPEELDKQLGQNAISSNPRSKHGHPTITAGPFGTSRRDTIPMGLHSAIPSTSY